VQQLPRLQRVTQWLADVAGSPCPLSLEGTNQGLRVGATVPGPVVHRTGPVRPRKVDLCMFFQWLFGGLGL
jgi:hypothetical protein